MTTYQNMSKEELVVLQKELQSEYELMKEKNLHLDMSRGKPASEQLDIAMDMMDVFNSQSDLKSTNGVDCRNYGIMDGIDEAKALLAAIIDVEVENVVVVGNSSLQIMFDTVARSITHGIMGNTPWSKLDKVKFLCPVPGYDRHFAITEHFGIEMINIPMTSEGPDMNMVEEYVNNDETVKGIWCVPKYSNPTGYTYSDEVVRRFANLKPAAKDFRIFWDDAYVVHHLYDDKQDQLLEILAESEKAGNPDIVYKFASTSKVSFAGAGLGAIASSKANVADYKKHMQFQTIGSNKLNQLLHARYFVNLDGVTAHMKKHAALVRPKFEIVYSCLEKELKDLGIGTWTKPLGGYFISFDAMEGCAKAIVQKTKEAGLIMTGAGATYPYQNDPTDSNIRIAPTFPSVEELEVATQLFVLSVKLCSIDKILATK